MSMQRKKAEKIADFSSNKPSGDSEDAAADRPEPGSALQVMPLEQCQIKGELSGTRGTNRNLSGRSSLKAGNDLEALRAWLNARAANPNTFSAYRKEAERFLLWCVIERRTALSSLTMEGASLYLRWLEDLGRLSDKAWAERWNVPQSIWIGAKNVERTDPSWKPFNGPLSFASRRQAMTVIRLLFNFLVKTGYLNYSPFDQVPPKIPFLPGEGAPEQFADRSLSHDQWEDILDQLRGLPEGEEKARFEAILMMGKGLGMRASEMLASRAGWIRKRKLGNRSLLMIEVVGKGDKVRRLPLQQDHLRILNQYLRTRGLQPIGACPPDTPLLTRLGRGRKAEHKGTSLSRSGLHKILKTFFEDAAVEAEKKDPMDGAKLREASTHWLRHTFAAVALDAMPVNVVQTALGHASLSTTSLYLVPTEQKMAEGMKKIKPL